MPGPEAFCLEKEKWTLSIRVMESGHLFRYGFDEFETLNDLFILCS